MFNNFCMSLLPMHKKQDYLFFLSLMYCSFYLRFVCPVEYILFMFTPHNTDLNVFFFLIFIQHNIDKQKTNVNQKKSKMKCLMNVWCLLNGKLTNQDNDCFTLMRCKNGDTLCSTSIYIHKQKQMRFLFSHQLPIQLN